MDTTQIIEFTDKWREENNFSGCNTDETTLEDNELVYYLENPYVDGWVRQCYSVIPEGFYELSENEQKDFLIKKYKQELNSWIEDDDDFYRNIGFKAGLGEDNPDLVREIIDNYYIFDNASQRLSE